MASTQARAARFPDACDWLVPAWVVSPSEEESRRSSVEMRGPARLQSGGKGPIR
jgi:hypothetical protein